MNILGIDWGEHDSAACLLQDGRLVAAAEEERFTRIKHAPFAFPERAARYCMGAGGITAADVDIVAHSFSPAAWLGRGFLHALRHFPHASFIAAAEVARRAWYMAAAPYARYCLKLGRRTRHVRVPHHMAHAASAFFASPFEETAVLVVDGVGEWATTSIYHGMGNRLVLLDKVDFPHSLGLMYAAFTEYLGFEPFDGEYKVMGLAAYGEPTYAEQMREIIRCPGPKSIQFRLDLRHFNFHRDYGRTTWYSPYMEAGLGPPWKDDGMPPGRYRDIAASVQRRTEEIVLHLADQLRQRTGLPCLCMAGGVMLNSVANGKIITKGRFDRVYIQPAANDAGCAVGAALYVQHTMLKGARREAMPHVYLGPEFPSSMIESHLRLSNLSYERIEDPPEKAARLLVDGKIIGWFQGRMEFGPRALGNRSILADPRLAGMKDRLNAVVKFREPFRPFAPSVPSEDSDRYFEPVGLSPFMLRVTAVKPAARERLPAITHVDGTARLHTVSRETNPLYHDLLQRFGAHSGVPVLLNTSFNVKGEPIVCSPRDAIATFFNSGLDALIIGPFLLQKPAPELIGSH